MYFRQLCTCFRHHLDSHHLPCFCCCICWQLHVPARSRLHIANHICRRLPLLLWLLHSRPFVVLPFRFYRPLSLSDRVRKALLLCGRQVYLTSASSARCSEFGVLEPGIAETPILIIFLSSESTTTRPRKSQAGTVVCSALTTSGLAGPSDAPPCFQRRGASEKGVRKVNGCIQAYGVHTECMKHTHVGAYIHTYFGSYVRTPMCIKPTHLTGCVV